LSQGKIVRNRRHSDDFISAARSFIGTPFRHQGRRPGVGLDCIGVMVCAAWAAGYEVDDIANYSRRPNGQLIPNLERQLDSIPIDDAEPGDIVAFWITRCGNPQHIGVLSFINPMTIIHARLVPRSVKGSFVCESQLSPDEIARLHPRAFRLRD